jgi:hypothetical protein
MNNDDDNNNPKESSSPDKPSSAEKQQLSHETPQAGDAESVTVTVAVTPTKKRRGSRKEEAGATSSGVQKPKRKVELLDPPTRDPDCVVCGKHFHSWKALFGHMRSVRGGRLIFSIYSVILFISYLIMNLFKLGPIRIVNGVGCFLHQLELGTLLAYCRREKKSLRLFSVWLRACWQA